MHYSFDNSRFCHHDYTSDDRLFFYRGATYEKIVQCIGIDVDDKAYHVLLI